MSNSHYVLTDAERRLLQERLVSCIEKSEMNFDEFIFATSDLMKGHFWFNLIQGKSEQEVIELQTRVLNTISSVVKVIESNTETIAEDLVILFTIILEASNQVFVQIKQQVEAMETTNTQELVEETNA